jgi:hypothetical protein
LLGVHEVATPPHVPPLQLLAAAASVQEPSDPQHAPAHGVFSHVIPRPRNVPLTLAQESACCRLQPPAGTQHAPKQGLGVQVVPAPRKFMLLPPQACRLAAMVQSIPLQQAPAQTPG